MRDIEEYTKKYNEQSFEPYMVKYRRKKVLEEIEKYSPVSVLEIGCGMEPLFKDVLESEFTIVEPSVEFALNANELSKKMGRNIVIIQDFFENTVDIVRKK